MSQPVVFKEHNFYTIASISLDKQPPMVKRWFHFGAQLIQQALNSPYCRAYSAELFESRASRLAKLKV